MKFIDEYRDPALVRGLLARIGKLAEQLKAPVTLMEVCGSHTQAIGRYGLREGAILAIKGLGGFHLGADAGNDEALKRLRARKYREEKPLAVMVRDIGQAAALVELTPADRELLLSPARPIVLARRKEGAPLSPAVAPGMSTLGIMLPYTPLQHLLLEGPFAALVMTSANQIDEPICIGNREALERLRGIADFFLLHDRDILVRCDDSVVMAAGGGPYPLRRARGYVPRAVTLRETFPEVLALGPHLKATICILKKNNAFLSPHIGDMETPQARDFFHENIALMERITECRPELIACDLHPGYYSSMVARDLGRKEMIAVQHHHAHIVSCMAENGLSGEVIGLAMDGSGYGTDGHIWGGEFLVADERNSRRAGHLREYRLPGAEKAVREPWRTAISLLRCACGEQWPGIAERLQLVPDNRPENLLERMMAAGINSPWTSSLGRIFDGVAAVLGLRSRVSFEGQAAMELEALAAKSTEWKDPAFPYAIEETGDVIILDLFAAVGEIARQRLGGAGAAGLAFAFHETLQRAFTDMAGVIRRRTGLNRVVLSGGCFQNRILLEGTIRYLTNAGFEVFRHRQVPANDGGIALGQAVCAGARVKGDIKSLDTGGLNGQS